MPLPETTPYGNRDPNHPDHYLGTLYRFDGAEHVSIEVGPRSVHVRLSTQHGADFVREVYEKTFGIEPVVEPDEEDSFLTTETAGNNFQKQEAAIVLGPMAVMIVDTEEFVLSWSEPDQVFHDRLEETAAVFMRQGEPALDFRHVALLQAVAEPNVQTLLPRILPT